MATRILSFLFFILSISIAQAKESQIILVQSEAYLVTLDENYDVLKIIERVPDYFQNHSTHEEILADHVRLSGNEAYGCNHLLLEANQMEAKEIACHSAETLELTKFVSNLSYTHTRLKSHRIDPRYRSSAV